MKILDFGRFPWGTNLKSIFWEKSREFPGNFIVNRSLPSPILYLHWICRHFLVNYSVINRISNFFLTERQKCYWRETMIFVMDETLSSTSFHRSKGEGVGNWPKICDTSTEGEIIVGITARSILEHRAAMVNRNPTEIIFWKSFDFLARVRSPEWQISFFTFLFNLTQLELRIIPIQKFCWNNK